MITITTQKTLPQSFVSKFSLKNFTVTQKLFNRFPMTSVTMFS